ncbi:FecR family protein [Butyricimonas faecalis]|uniref:FecR family protein n=1 Tax=Butyricimonas faecalis TaxID=2093856 RepID=A0A3Q9IMJ7_9BACT|nr:FecR domain-containing protein [Butyricimonas faecalis]AZS28607.1 FecR family protein [Butyricimonas faecalis]
MKPHFAEDIWEKLLAVWRKDYRAGEEPDYREEQMRQLLKTMFMSRQALKLREKQEYDVHEAWQRVNKRTRAKGSRRMIRGWMKYAALFILFLGIVSLWRVYDNKEKPIVAAVQSDSILPGRLKAELILANGERIVLDSEARSKEMEALGIKLENDTVNGLLKYEAGAVDNSIGMKYNTLNVPKGGEYSLILPDGSRVWLNSETTLRFPVQFAGGKRVVYLSGEAYFQVKKDTSAAFHVCTKQQKITVLGTTFNVSAYENDRFTETTLIEGKVAVEGGAERVVMKPSEQYILDKRSGVGELKEVETEFYTSWIDGKFYFTSFTFEEIVKKLERWYDFTMIYEEDDIRQMRFSGVINKHRPIEEMLRFLEKTTDIHFKISGKNIVAGKN